VKLTNRYGAPDVFVRAIEADPYDKGQADFSVTGLLQPPQITRLWEENEDLITSDVSEEVWKLLGSGVHAVLEGHGDGTVEQRLFSEHDGVTISGAVDLVKDGHVTDYKVTSVYTATKSLKSDWESQLNLYAWLLGKNGTKVNSLTIVAICRDWMPSRRGQKNYPESMIVSIPVPLWSSERQERFVSQRIAVHTKEETTPCTDGERWMNAAGTKFIRCEGWCSVSEFCPQWKGGSRGSSKK
jgi:hypothetical protein